MISHLSGIVPGDPFDGTLVENVHPPAWTNPAPAERYDLVVIGGGTGGLVSALGGTGLGARVALVERGLLGGDCLNHGCVPSKGIIRAARAAMAAREAGEFGVRTGQVEVEFEAAMARMRRVRAHISRNDSAQRLREHGVDVFLGHARFIASDAVDVGGARLRFKRAILATGGRAAELPVPGMREAGFLTNETVFTLRERPRRLLVVGAGPIGCELGQTFRRLGSEVTMIALDPRVLPKDDPEAAAIIDARLREDGIRLELDAKLIRVNRAPEGKTILYERDGTTGTVAGDEILLAAGRVPNVEGLDLERAGVAYSNKGVRVDDRMQTTNPRAYAVGDVAARWQFTHLADAQARIALQNALFFGRKRASALVVPWCTYTDPEVAHVGLTPQDLQERGVQHQTFTVPLSEVDRAELDGETEGFARLHADRRGKILGATLVARHAGESIGEMALAMTAGLSMRDLARTIHPYPTQAEALKRAADLWMRSRLTPRVKLLLSAIVRLRK